MLSNIPNLVYLAPTCKEEYLAMLDWSVDQDKYPVVISMPGNGVHPAKYPVASSYDSLNEYQVCEKGEEVAVLALGDFFQLGEEAARSIEKETGKKVTLINPRFASGLDEKLLSDLKENHLTKELIMKDVMKLLHAKMLDMSIVYPHNAVILNMLCCIIWIYSKHYMEEDNYDKD